MADANSVVVLVNGSFESAETPRELAGRFRGGSSTEFVEIEDTKGITHWVPVAHVVDIHERPERSGYIT